MHGGCCLRVQGRVKQVPGCGSKVQGRRLSKMQGRVEQLQKCGVKDAWQLLLERKYWSTKLWSASALSIDDPRVLSVNVLLGLVRGCAVLRGVVRGCAVLRGLVRGCAVLRGLVRGCAMLRGLVRGSTYGWFVNVLGLETLRVLCPWICSGIVSVDVLLVWSVNIRMCSWVLSVDGLCSSV